jgi:hypothetical protein
MVGQFSEAQGGCMGALDNCAIAMQGIAKWHLVATELLVDHEIKLVEAKPCRSPGGFLNASKPIAGLDGIERAD